MAHGRERYDEKLILTLKWDEEALILKLYVAIVYINVVFNGLSGITDFGEKKINETTLQPRKIGFIIRWLYLSNQEITDQQVIFQYWFCVEGVAE